MIDKLFTVSLCLILILFFYLKLFFLKDHTPG